ncbi:MAG: ATPase [Hyphomonadaceae bacterium]
MEHDVHAAAEAAHTAATPLFQDPATWTGIALIIFLAILVWKKVPAAIAKSLDDRAAKIAGELANAEALRKEAEGKLEDAKKRQAEAEEEAKAIVTAAKREAEILAADAASQLQDSIARRQKMAEDRIARAEADALRDVKAAAVETASRAAAAVLTEQLSGKAADDHFAKSLDAVKKALS